MLSPTPATATVPAPKPRPEPEKSDRALSISADDVERVLNKVTNHIQSISPQDDLHALVTDFKSFIQRGNIVDLAIGMIMGTSFTAILQSLVVDILSPILSLVSTRSLGNYYAVARCPDHHKDCDSDSWETPQMARDSGAITINYGLFIENVVRFFINAIFLYFAVKRDLGASHSQSFSPLSSSFSVLESPTTMRWNPFAAPPPPPPENLSLLDRVQDRLGRVQELASRELVTTRALLTDFHEFIQQGNMLNMAVGLILGSSFSAILNSLVVDILSPIISLFTGKTGEISRLRSTRNLELTCCAAGQHEELQITTGQCDAHQRHLDAPVKRGKPGRKVRRW
ncbi:unnamed protein product [Phytophthora lilii]|uniref:Unnamed protein product n=1 Tax=Phytophthora lilii TaxID=2077276 RepID=A0A9W6UC37_9STRA|nr:unnamed protein product [Phytophthora lilii]